MPLGIAMLRPRRIAAICFALAGLPALTHAQVDRRTLAGAHVAIYNLAGRLRVRGESGNQVTVEITRGGRDASRLSIATGQVRGAETLRVIYPSDRIVYSGAERRFRTDFRVDDDGTFDDDNGRRWNRGNRVEIRDSGSGLEAFADLVVGVPRGQSISLHWGVGDAVVSNVDGDIHLSVASAAVTTEHTRGALGLSTGSGHVSVTDAQGDVLLDTGSGGVSIDGIRGDQLRLDTGSGSVTGGNVDVKTLKADVGSGGLRLSRAKAERVSADVGSGGFDLDLMNVVSDLSVETGSGGVTLRLPAGQGADVDIETGSGGIESDFAIQTTRMARNHVRGRIGDGRGRIRVEAGSGSVRLIKAG